MNRKFHQPSPLISKNTDRNKIEGAYLDSEFLPESRKLIQAWADLVSLIQPAIADRLELEPTYPGTSIPDYSACGYITQTGGGGYTQLVPVTEASQT
ncbi:MAG: hypothetical protein RLZZ627_1573 [Pseudomonadota bacterium]|jgi:hypothetical protein